MDEDFGALFEEPEDFRPAKAEDHYVDYPRFSLNLENGKFEKASESVTPENIRLKLIGQSPLWGHLLWNAGKYTANYLELHSKELVRDKKILELGAAGGLPSLICSLYGADKIVVTDYPDADLIENIKANFMELHGEIPKNVSVQGYIWGNSYDNLLSFTNNEKFDLIILSDLVFNHTEHLKLLQTCKDLLSPQGKCFVVFSPHRPHLLENDLEFFETAKNFDFKVDKNDLVNWTPMFDEDPETAEIRGRVYSFWMQKQNL